MNDLADSTLTPALLFLADWSLRWVAITGVLLLGLALRPPRRPATRLLLCRLVFLGGLLLPFVPRYAGLTVPFARVSTLTVTTRRPAVEALPRILPSESPVVARAIPDDADSAPSVLLGALPAEESSKPVPANASTFLGIERVLVLSVSSIWLAGVALLMGQLGLGWVRLARLRRSAQPVGAAELELWNQCRSELSVRRPADLCAHPAIEAPVLLGGIHPKTAYANFWRTI